MAERQRTHGALAVASRAQLLDALRDADRPLSAAELADGSGLHISTVRFHLDVLTEAGLVRSRVETASRRGRPRLLHYPVRTGKGSSRAAEGYRFLAGILAANLADTSVERAQRAERAGYAAAVAQVTRRSPSTALSMTESVAELAGTFAELGFEPDVVPDGDGLQIQLHACPFEAVASAHPEVVCALHLGLIRGALAISGGAATASGLQPFAAPDLCIARINPTGPATGEGSTTSDDR